MCKKLMFAAAFAAMALTGCNKENVETSHSEQNAEMIQLTVNVPVSTKSVMESDESAITNLQIMVFDANGVLEGYRNTTSTSVTITCTSGQKTIAAFANAPDFGNVTKLADMYKMKSQLVSQSPTFLCMEGYVTKNLEASSTVNIALRRMVAKISIKSVMNLFELKQHQDMEFKITSIYLVNVPGECMFMADPDVYVPELWFNKKSNEKAYPHIYDEISGGEKIEYAMEYSQEHYFYCYPNVVEDDIHGGEGWSPRKTRLVVEATLGGSTYYYPITLDRVEQNTYYSYKLDITRPGSSSPDIPVDDSAMTFNVVVEDWNTYPTVLETI